VENCLREGLWTGELAGKETVDRRTGWERDCGHVVRQATGCTNDRMNKRMNADSLERTYFEVRKLVRNVTKDQVLYNSGMN
jgi:hypothetical protein